MVMKTRCPQTIARLKFGAAAIVYIITSNMDLEQDSLGWPLSATHDYLQLDNSIQNIQLASLLPHSANYPFVYHWAKWYCFNNVYIYFFILFNCW